MTVYVSHSPADDGFVKELGLALREMGEEPWLASQELRGGDERWGRVRATIEAASAYAVVVSPNALKERDLARELRLALEVQKRRQAEGKGTYPVIPLALDGTPLGALEGYFDGEPVCVPIPSDRAGIDESLHKLLVALGKRAPGSLPPASRVEVQPLEELVLELSDLKVKDEGGVRRASAKARLVDQPATPGQREVQSARPWRLVAPMGPIEAEELRWYLEKYALWPSEYFAPRARKVEASLAEWGQLLHQAAFPAEHTGQVMIAWGRAVALAGRRFSVQLDSELEAGAPESEKLEAREAATLLLGLPWELLHDGTSYLFQGAKPTRVRRRLPNTQALDVPVLSPPIRILLVTARPEDGACGYIDHRVSALPLVETMEALGGLVSLTVLQPPTLPALRKELDRARKARQPYHVVHFDGHGVYDRRVGLGGLCFEEPEDAHPSKLTQRRHKTVYTEELGPLLRDHRIPLVFLEACQTAQAESGTESVASALLQAGVASVVAMSHSVLVETARRFVEAFYRALTQGFRVGDAMLEGQRTLKDNTARGRIFGLGELRLEDWFVPVLFQEEHDPQLFTSTPAPQTRADILTRLEKRLGSLPKEPTTGFIGRSRELLALQRLLLDEHHAMPAGPGGKGQRYAVLRGQGGEGKTALAAEFGRWVVRSGQVYRAAFASVEAHSTPKAVLSTLGEQLVGPKYSAATHKTLDAALEPVVGALRQRSTLLVIDNMEAILLPPYVSEPEALSADMQENLGAILKLCERLGAAGETRLLFTSREALPPLDAPACRLELHQLSRDDAVKLVERTLNQASSALGEAAGPPSSGSTGAAAAAKGEAIEALVEAVHCHARTLTLLAPSLQSQGVEATHAALVELMAQMEARYPGDREKSVYASVELSLRRLSPENRERVRVLGVFHGAVDLDMLRAMTEWEVPQVGSLADELVGTGLAAPDPYNHLTLNPALCPLLAAQLDSEEAASLQRRWCDAMGSYVGALLRKQDKHTDVAATLTLLERANLFLFLERLENAGDATETLSLAVRLHQLFQNLGRPRLVERLAQAAEAAEARLGETWNHARFQAKWTRIEWHRKEGNLTQALREAHALARYAEKVAETAYPEATCDIAMSRWQLGRVFASLGKAQNALALLVEAQKLFESLGPDIPGKVSERMASVCVADQGDALRDLGRLDEAVSAYEESIRLAQQQGDERGVAVGRGQLGSVRLLQRRYDEALQAYREARDRFDSLNEPGGVAIAWHQIGWTHQEAGQAEAAEDAYRKSLSIGVQLGSIAQQADTLNQLGCLYGHCLGRHEEAATFHRRAIDMYIELGNRNREGAARNNLAIRLRVLGQLDEARSEIERALECRTPLGHAAQPWKAWDILADIERDAGNLTPASSARRNARDSFLAYRRDRGENHGSDGRLAVKVNKWLHAYIAGEATATLDRLVSSPDTDGQMRTFVKALQAIVSGSRDRGLADNPGLSYSMAAEVLWLIETLEAAGK